MLEQEEKEKGMGRGESKEMEKMEEPEQWVLTLS